MSRAAIEAAFAGTLGGFTLDVAFEMPMKGITALFGASGCGKTTVLRCMSGLQHLPGRLAVGGEVWQDSARGVFRKPHRRPVGYVFQEASLFAHLSVRDNLLYGARRARRDGPDTPLDFDGIVALLGIGHLLGRAPAALSGGERQRVAVGRALLAAPRLLLMDEPLSALDRMTKEQILPYLETLHEHLSIPVLYVSHDISEVLRLADRMVVLSEGRKVADGPVRDVMDRLDLQPATGRFEAGVVLDARVVGYDATYHLSHLDLHGQKLVIPSIGPSIGAEAGEEIRVRIRARDVALATRRPEGVSIRNVLAGTVVEIAEEPDTAFAETLVDIGGGRVRARITREALADLALEIGTPVFALVKSVAFDRRTLSGARIEAD